MLSFVKGDLFTSGAEALVNPVNCVGVMGKGLALEFKKRYPENFVHYVNLCMSGVVQIGKMTLTAYADDGNPNWIINFPTKRDWRDKSQIEWIAYGMIDLKEVLRDLDIKSVAIPALGCGLGGLPWKQVKPLYPFLEDLNIEILVYEPN